jgi:hypothetical protein
VRRWALSLEWFQPKRNIGTGTTARFRFTPPAVKSLIKRQKHLKNCEVPYSSEANKKEKLKLDVLGWKSNSIYVALTELMLTGLG